MEVLLWILGLVVGVPVALVLFGIAWGGVEWVGKLLTAYFFNMRGK